MRQLVVPMGGVRIGWIGWIDGGTIGQICGAQMTGMSRAARQSCCTEPFTHRHVHCAYALVLASRARAMRIRRMVNP
jgi:hypothetical protein